MGVQVAAHTSFERLSAEGLAAALRSDALCVSGELAAFQAAARWLGAEPARAPLAPDILQVPSGQYVLRMLRHLLVARQDRDRMSVSAPATGSGSGCLCACHAGRCMQIALNTTWMST